MTTFFSFSFFLITLQSFYFPVIGSALTYVGYCFFIFLGIKSHGMKKGLFYFSLVLIICLSLHSIIIIYFGFSDADFKSVLALFAMLASLPLVYKSLELNKNRVTTAIKFTLIIHVSLLFVQIVYFLANKQYLDFLQIIVGDTARTMSLKGLMAFGVRVPRFAGLFNEPGSYSIVIMSLTLAYYSTIKKVDTLILFSVVSCLLTMSSFAFLLVIFFAIVVLVFDRRSRIKLVLALFLIAFGFVFIGGFEAIAKRFSGEVDYGGMDFRQKMLDYYFLNTQNFFLGVRIEDYPTEFIFIPNDIGLWFSFVINFGLFGWLMLAIFFGYTWQQTKRFEITTLLGIILMTKLKFTYPFFWVIFLIFLAKNKNKKVK